MAGKKPTLPVVVQEVATFNDLAAAISPGDIYAPLRAVQMQYYNRANKAAITVAKLQEKCEKLALENESIRHLIHKQTRLLKSAQTYRLFGDRVGLLIPKEGPDAQATSNDSESIPEA